MFVWLDIHPRNPSLLQVSMTAGCSQCWGRIRYADMLHLYFFTVLVTEHNIPSLKRGTPYCTPHVFAVSLPLLLIPLGFMNSACLSYSPWCFENLSKSAENCWQQFWVGSAQKRESSVLLFLLLFVWFFCFVGGQETTIFLVRALFSAMSSEPAREAAALWTHFPVMNTSSTTLQQSPDTQPRPDHHIQSSTAMDSLKAPAGPQQIM